MDRSPKYSLLEAKQKIEAYCAYQERCDFEVRTKLRSWFLHLEDIDVLISDLISNNFLNEERFAEAYVSGKFRIKKWGKIKIKLYLKQKNISDYSINKGLAQINQEEYLRTLQELIESKSRLSTFKDEWDRKVKLTRYLSAKGYERALIMETLGEV